MVKFKIFSNAFAILLQWTVFSLKDELFLKNISNSNCESQLKCVFDPTIARGFCGILPINFLLEYKNATFKYQKADFQDQQIVVWQKSCNIVDKNSYLGELPQIHNGSMGHELFTGEGFPMSIEEAVGTFCSNGIQDIVGGLPLKCIRQETFAEERCDQSNSMKLIKNSPVLMNHPDQQVASCNSNSKVKDMKKSYFININEHLSEVNRKSVQQILNSCLRERILDSKYDLGTLVFALPRLKSKIYVNQVNLNSLSRFNGYGSAVFVQNEPTPHEEIITDPVKLLDILREELNFSIFLVDQALNKLYVELNSHIMNAVLLSYGSKVDDWRNSQQIYNNLIPQELSDYSHKFEKFVSNGPPYYPFPKSKVGFSFRDIFDFSAEFQPKVLLMLVAAHRSVIGIATNIEDFNYNNWFSQHYFKEWSHWVHALHRKGMSQEDYIPIPVHPWQFTHHVERIFVDLIENKILVPLGVKLEVSPTASLRTVLSMRNLSAPYMKLPVSIKATSSIRVSSTNIVKTVPVLSGLVARIVTSESSISEKLNIMRDDIGLYLNITDKKRAEYLTVTFRENVVACCLRGKEIAVVIAALFEKLSATNTSLFIHIMRFAGYTTLKGAVQYFTKYVDLVIGSYLDLYLIYGISLEGHQQNTLAVFENGHIKRFIAKDLAGLEISASVLKSHTSPGDISAVSPYCKENDEFYPRIQLLHTVYQLHLGELLILLADHFNCSEKLFWDIIKNKTEERFEALKERVDSVRWRNEYNAILKADWAGISFLRKHFQNDDTQKLLYHSFKNPLN